MSSIRNPKGLHHGEHETGGVDALTTLDGGILLTGTVPDARHSANVAMRNGGNTFTVSPQVVSKSSFPVLAWNESGQPSGGRNFAVFSNTGNLCFGAADDAYAAPGPFAVTLDRAGNARVGLDVYEKGRTTPMGHWTTYPYSAGLFSANAGSWIVEAGDVQLLMYMLVGKTIWLAFNLVTTTVTASPTELYIVLPLGLSAAANAASQFWYYDGSGKFGVSGAISNLVAIRRDPFATAWTPLTNGLYLFGTAMLPIG